MYLYSAPLGYQVPFLAVEHGIDLYPVTIQVEGDEGLPLEAGDPDEFAARLKEVFSREKTKKTIASIMAQSKE